MPTRTPLRTAPRPSPFLEQIVRFLIPFFIGSATDFDAARADILETLASYGAQTRSQMLNAAQIIAFGMSALETLAEVNAAEMSPSMCLRHRSCANGLNRSGQQHEKALAVRLTCHHPNAAEPEAEPTNDVPAAQVQATIQQTQATIDTTRARLSPVRSVSASPLMGTPQQDRNKQLWGGAMIDTLAQMGMPVVAAPASQNATPRSTG
jgi:hypothetical protein